MPNPAYIYFLIKTTYSNIIKNQQILYILPIYVIHRCKWILSDSFPQDIAKVQFCDTFLVI